MMSEKAFPQASAFAKQRCDEMGSVVMFARGAVHTTNKRRQHTEWTAKWAEGRSRGGTGVQSGSPPT